MNFLITGCAGFIGFHITDFLCRKYKKSKIHGIDNLNNFYSIKLKNIRLKKLRNNKNFYFKKLDLNEKNKIENIFKNNKIDIVLNFAAQAGVRDSLKMPKSYFDSNFQGFLNLIGLSEKYNIKKFIFASSSSVYGDQKKFPINENNKIVPKNIYSATKKINEDIALDLSKISKMKLIGLRFFTVYGKYGRPDMFVYKYLKTLFTRKKFDLFNRGKNFRDYTHIEDVVNIIDRIVNKKLKKNFDLFNICSNKPIDIYKLSVFISNYLRIKSKLELKKRNTIEVIKTHGNNRKILKLLNYKIKKNIFLELPAIIDWYQKKNFGN